jgi:hypothetical protein
MSENYEEIGKFLASDPAFMAAMTKGFTEALAKQQEDAAKATAQKATMPNNPSYNMVHGDGSMFGAVQVGIDPDVISAMMHWRGIGELLPREPVRTIEQFLPFITGVEPTSSTEPTTECGDCISGESEACIQHFPTAKVCRETKAMTLQKAIERLNRGDIDLQLLNDQLGSDSPWHPGGSFTTQGEIMQVATAWALLFELPPLFMHALSPMVYTGNPTNNNGNAYREFRGLELLVNTGFVDAFANVTCPALDSDLKDFNYGNIKTTTNPSFHETLEMAHYYVRNNARGQRLDPVQWAVVMRPELWQMYSSLLPYQSILATMMNATIPNSYEVKIDGGSLVSERDSIRQGMTVNLNGENVRVVIDDGITESNNANDANCEAGEYASDVYLLPIRYLGGRSAMRIEYKDYRFMSGEIAATNDLIAGFYQPSPDGRFSYSLVRDGRCFKIQAETEPRIILKTPQLAARIQNVKYVPLQHLREPSPDGSYFFKGGVSTRAPTSYYH